MERKVAIPAVAGAVTTIVHWALQEFAGVTMPAFVVGASTTLVMFVLGYLVPNKPAGL